MSIIDSPFKAMCPTVASGALIKNTSSVDPTIAHFIDDLMQTFFNTAIFNDPNHLPVPPWERAELDLHTTMLNIEASTINPLPPIPKEALQQGPVAFAKVFVPRLMTFLSTFPLFQHLCNWKTIKDQNTEALDCYHRLFEHAYTMNQKEFSLLFKEYRSTLTVFNTAKCFFNHLNQALTISMADQKKMENYLQRHYNPAYQLPFDSEIVLEERLQDLALTKSP